MLHVQLTTLTHCSSRKGTQETAQSVATYGSSRAGNRWGSCYIRDQVDKCQWGVAVGAQCSYQDLPALASRSSTIVLAQA